MLTFGSLFAGIGGFDLGFERAGMRCIWQCEIDPWARAVLTKHWPNVIRYEDVRDIDETVARPDIICGGFPCQDISSAGKKVGIHGDKSGLWFEFARVIRLLRPRIVVVENVAALLDRGMDRVLGELAACGFDAEWEVLPAGSVGAPHVRERVFVVAYPHGKHGGTWRPRRLARTVPWLLIPGESRKSADEAATGLGHWATEPGLVRLVPGIPPAVDRLRGLGNSVVPDVAEFIGRRIVEFLSS